MGVDWAVLRLCLRALCLRHGTRRRSGHLRLAMGRSLVILAAAEADGGETLQQRGALLVRVMLLGHAALRLLGILLLCVHRQFVDARHARLAVGALGCRRDERQRRLLMDLRSLMLRLVEEHRGRTRRQRADGDVVGHDRGLRLVAQVLGIVLGHVVVRRADDGRALGVHLGRGAGLRLQLLGEFGEALLGVDGLKAAT
jgi:hypothetical protein